MRPRPLFRDWGRIMMQRSEIRAQTLFTQYGAQCGSCLLARLPVFARENLGSPEFLPFEELLATGSFRLARRKAQVKSTIVCIESVAP